MNCRRSKYLNILRRQMVIALVLLAIFVGAPTSLPPGLRLKVGWLMMVASAQDDPIQALSDEYARLERQGLEEDGYRRASFIMLQEYLPTGTRMTSGYRSPERQLDLIIRMARARGIPTSPNKPSIDDESTWRPAFRALQAQGIIIASPTTTPHATDETVFDLSGADLGQIKAGLLRAEKAGMVVFTKIIPESRNNAVHVEVKSISPKALRVFGIGKRGSADLPPAPVNQAATPHSSPEADQQRNMLQQLQSLHDSEPDPAKKIDYDRTRKNLLDPAVEYEKIKALDDEIAQHQRETKQLGDQTQKKEAIYRASEALQDERFEDAELEAENLVKEFPDSREAINILAQIKTRRLVSAAQDALYASDEPGCGECKQADQLISEALELYPDHEGAQSIRADTDACLERCKPKPVVVVILGVFVFVLTSSIIGLYFLSRSGTWLTDRAKDSRKWVLEGIEGPCKGQTFLLDNEKIAIGAQGPPDGKADIVICDPERKISRTHCLIMHNGKRFYLLDESTNGTKINDQQIKKGVLAEFRGGDRISLADEAVLQLRPE